MIGMILSMQGKAAEARQQYERALAMDPQAVAAANNLAWQYAEAGNNLDLALQLAQTAKAALPDNAQINDTLGVIYHKKGLMGPAIRALRQGAQQDPSNPRIHYHLGLAYYKNGNTSEAIGALQKALKLNPQFREAEDAKRVLATLEG